LKKIIIGRKPSDYEKFGELGTVLIGKQYVYMDQFVSLANPAYMDVIRTHAILIAGKRGSGKSYTMGVIAEGLATAPKEVSDNISTVIFDTMGIYWTMKFPNRKDQDLLEQWGLPLKPLDNVDVFVPYLYYDIYREKEIPVDYPFALTLREVLPQEWREVFGLPFDNPIAILIEKVITDLRERNDYFSFEDIISYIEKTNAPSHIKDGAILRFQAAEKWGLFKEKGLNIDEIVNGGRVSVLDLSPYIGSVGGWSLRALVINLVAKAIFLKRIFYRKFEEVKDVLEYFYEKKDFPLTWLMIDEAHEFLPREPEKTLASDILVQILREGRQPGVSLVLATQQPGKLHTDAMTQSDIVFAHRVTSKLDIAALENIMQTYAHKGLAVEMERLPRWKGSVLVLDDNSERIFPMRIRPRFTWHGGEDPIAIKKTYL
jgi:hypothetical protein